LPNRSIYAATPSWIDLCCSWPRPTDELYIGWRLHASHTCTAPSALGAHPSTRRILMHRWVLGRLLPAI
jgi:hypothetical protein